MRTRPSSSFPSASRRRCRAFLAAAVLVACAPAATPTDVLEMPTPRSDSDVVGTAIGELLPTRWVGAPAVVQGEGAPKATLVRWWTDTCPFCSSSLPAIEELRDAYGEDGFAAIGVYHPKPPRPTEDAAVAAAAEERGFHGALAIDEEWEALREIWLDRGGRRATSVSFLLDDEGVVRYVHPGPEFFPAEHAVDPARNRDYDDLETAIRVLLAEDD